MPANRPDSDMLEIYLKLAFQGDQLPGYGWVFPIGGRADQHRPRLRQQLLRSGSRSTPPQFLGEFLETLPRRVGAALDRRAQEIERACARGGCRWASRPGRRGVRGAVHGRLAGCGQTAPAARASPRRWSPAWPPGECALAALQNGGPDDFTNYALRMEAAWGKEYRRGRYFHKLLGMPAVANAGIKLHRQCPLSATPCSSDVQAAQGPQHTY